MPTATERPLPWRSVPGGLIVRVRLTPRGGRDRLEGLAEIDGRPALKARVAAAPAGGAANRALERLLAKAAGIAPSAVEVTAGAASRLKRVTLTGDPEGLADALAARL